VKRHLFQIIIGLATLGLYSGEAFAVKALDFQIHQQYISTRALGMGNAFTATVDDHNAILYNPAALALRKEGNIRLFLGAGLSDDVLDFKDDLSKVVDTKNEQAIMDYLATQYGTNLELRLPRLGGFWARPGWEVAFIPADLTINMAIHRSAGPAINVNAYLDNTLAYAYAKKFNWLGAEHPIAMGITAKAIHRAQVSELVSGAQLIVDSDVFRKEDAQEGLIADIDIGSLWSPKIKRDSWYKKIVPDTLAVTMRNVLELGTIAQFDIIADNPKEPDDMQRVIDLGTKYNLPGFWKFQSNKFAFDIRDLLNDNWTIRKGLHLGAEFGWEMYSWWKGFWSLGLNQGYWTAGFGGQMSVFRLEFASWGEEVGTKSNTKENRRYLVELSLDF